MRYYTDTKLIFLENKKIKKTDIKTFSNILIKKINTIEKVENVILKHDINAIVRKINTIIN